MYEDLPVYQGNAALPPGVREICSRADNEQTWLAERAKLRCTGSRAGAKLGVSPFTEGNGNGLARRRMQIGSILEGAVLADPAVRVRLNQHPPWADSELWWNKNDRLIADEQGLGATPDGMMMKGNKITGIVEVKFVSASWQNVDPPAYYQAQAALTAHVLGTDDYAVACWQQSASGVVREYVWFSKVSNGVPVLGETMKWEKAVKILAGDDPFPHPPPEAYAGITEATPEILKLLDEVRAARAVKKEGTDREGAAKKKLFELVGRDPVEITDEFGNRAAEITVSVRSGLDKKALEKDHPAIVSQYAKTTEAVYLHT